MVFHLPKAAVIFGLSSAVWSYLQKEYHLRLVYITAWRSLEFLKNEKIFLKNDGEANELIKNGLYFSKRKILVIISAFLCNPLDLVLI